MWICVIFMCITQIISQMNTLFPSGMKVKVKVVQLCPTLCDPMDYIVHGILQPRILEWVAFPFSWGASQPRNQTQISHIAGGFFTNWAMKEALCDPASPWTVACQAPLPMEFSRQEHWSGLPFPSPVHESEKWKWSRSVVSDPATPWTAAFQTPLSMGFSRQEYWSGVPLPFLLYSI